MRVFAVLFVLLAPCLASAKLSVLSTAPSTSTPTVVGEWDGEGGIRLDASIDDFRGNPGWNLGLSARTAGEAWELGLDYGRRAASENSTAANPNALTGTPLPASSSVSVSRIGVRVVRIVRLNRVADELARFTESPAASREVRRWRARFGIGLDYHHLGVHDSAGGSPPFESSYSHDRVAPRLEASVSRRLWPTGEIQIGVVRSWAGRAGRFAADYGGVSWMLRLSQRLR